MKNALIAILAFAAFASAQPVVTRLQIGNYVEVTPGTLSSTCTVREGGIKPTRYGATVQCAEGMRATICVSNISETADSSRAASCSEFLTDEETSSFVDAMNGVLRLTPASIKKNYKVKE